MVLGTGGGEPANAEAVKKSGKKAEGDAAVAAPKRKAPAKAKPDGGEK